jgi:cytochrome c556
MRHTTDMNRFGLFALTCAVVMMAVPVLAAEDLVATRQADMKAMAAAAKTISSYVQGSFELANTIRDRSRLVLAGHFVSEAAAGSRSKARPIIIEERDRFHRFANDLRAYAVALDAAAEKKRGPMPARMRMKPREAKGGSPLGTQVRNEQELSAITAEHAFHVMLQTCTSCHARFRDGMRAICRNGGLLGHQYRSRASVLL